MHNLRVDNTPVQCLDLPLVLRSGRGYRSGVYALSNYYTQEHMIKGAGNCTYGKVQNCSPTFNKLASDMFPYKELLEPRAHTK